MSRSARWKGTGPCRGTAGCAEEPSPPCGPACASGRAQADTAAVSSKTAACGRPHARARAWLGCQAAAFTSPPCAASVVSASHRAKSHTCAGRPGPPQRAPHLCPAGGLAPCAGARARADRAVHAARRAQAVRTGLAAVLDPGARQGLPAELASHRRCRVLTQERARA